jgi:hypothetical protein
LFPCKKTPFLHVFPTPSPLQQTPWISPPSGHLALPPMALLPPGEDDLALSEFVVRKPSSS